MPGPPRVSRADASLSVANFVHTGEFRPHSRFTSTSADLVHIHVPAVRHAALRWHADAMSTATRAQLRLGTSGWTYASWKGTVYPAGVADRVRLEYYAANLFDTVELNAGYYRWPALNNDIDGAAVANAQTPGPASSASAREPSAVTSSP